MAKPKTENEGAKEPLVLIANLLGLILTKEATAAERIVTLARASFTNQEIADLIGSTTRNVAQTLYLSRQTKGQKKTKRIKKA